MVVHGDDFTFLGTKVDLRKVQAKMPEWYDVKGALGGARRDQGELEVGAERPHGRMKDWTRRTRNTCKRCCEDSD